MLPKDRPGYRGSGECGEEEQQDGSLLGSAAHLGVAVLLTGPRLPLPSAGSSLTAHAAGKRSGAGS